MAFLEPRILIGHHAVARLRAPKAVIVVLRDKFELHLHYKRGTNYERIKFPIAIGKEGSATPRGVYWVDAKVRRPDWRVPEDPDYLPEAWGTVIPFDDPSNPFEGGFLSLSDKEGVGIHGVRFKPQVGTRASHGCIRMNTKDLLRIYPRVPLGTPVVIV